MGRGRIVVYNVLGQKVKTLNCNSTEVYWNGRGEKEEKISSGLYYLVYNNKLVRVVKTK
jgi:hypothetical protein